MLAAFKHRIKQVASPAIWIFLRDTRTRSRLLKYRILGRPAYSGESTKAFARRLREGFFEKFCAGRGLDIGYGGDLLCENCVGWDVEHGDAQVLADIEAQSFDFVYSSHTLEHVMDAALALRNWYRAVKPGGFLILAVPDRDLYEKRIALPSQWNPDHKRFFLLDHDERPDTIGVLPLISEVIPEAAIIAARRCAEGHTIVDPLVHSDGEYSIEVIVRKPLQMSSPQSQRGRSDSPPNHA
jgi:SAM-dependent methyltransferase